MKKFKLVVACLIAILLTGCVKSNANMDIKKDKSMDFSIIYAVNSSLLGNEELLSADNKKSLEDQGFTISDYNQDNMKGFTVKRNIANIDKVSNEGDVQYSLSNIMDEKSESKYIFKVKKGLLKNTYTAKLKFDAEDSDLSNDANLDDTQWDTQADTDDSLDLDSFGSDADFSSMMSSMDLSFNVTLPYSALSNNATSTNDDNKKLTWTLTATDTKTIDFEFELYNMTNIYIGCGIIILVLILMIAIVLNKRNNSTNNMDNNVSPDIKPTTENNKAEI